MKTTKLIALAALATLFAGLPPAQAVTKKKPKPKPKPTCNLITDPKGDATGTGTGNPGPNVPSLDILSADIATNGKNFTVVWRTAVWDDNETYAPTGRAFEFAFKALGINQSFRVKVHAAGLTVPTGMTAAVDKTAKTLTLTGPLSTLKMPLKAGTKLIEFTASSWRYIGPSDGTLGMVDNSAGTKYYPATNPSCVKVPS